MRKVYLIILLALITMGRAAAQADCSSAIIICGNTTFYNPSGVGNKLEQLACGGIEHNSIWLAFQAKASGKLNFAIRTFNMAGLPTTADFDWSLYALPGAPNAGNCDAKTQLSCNFAGTSTVFGIPGTTGMATPNYAATAFNPGIDVVMGNWYVLMVDQFSNTTPLQFMVQFTDNPESPYLNSTPGIFDNRPDFTVVNNGGCAGSYSFTNNSFATAGIASYAWDFGDGSTSTAANPVHTYAAPGTYYVTLRVTDNNGCVAVNRRMIAFNNTAPTLNSAGLLLLPSCTDSNNGSITVTTIGATTPGVTGGTAPYTFELVSPSPTPVGPQSSGVFTGLAPGSYTIKVTDACGKSATLTATVSQIATNSTLGLGIQNIQSSCVGTPTGTATIFANGSVPPYTMQLIASSPVTTGVLPAIQRDPVTSTYFTTFTNLLPGSYTLEATDGCGKKRRATFTVTASTNPTVAVVNNPSCAGTPTGSLNVTATGATGLTTSGSPGTFQYALIAPSPIIRPFQNSSVFENLLPGTYTIAVRDVCGNIGTANNTIPTATAPTFGTAFTTPSCPNGATGTIEAQVNAVGGGTPFSFELIVPSPVIRAPQPDNTFANLPAGTYTVRITDACGTQNTSNVTVSPGAVPTFSTTITASCSTPASGTITVVPGASAIGPFTFELISPGAAIRPSQGSNIANSTSSIFTGLDQGSYTIRMTDGCGTPVTGTAIIGAPTALAFPAGSTTVPSCTAGSTGQITVAQPTTGLGAYKYEIIAPSPITRAPQYSRIFNNVPVGSYTIRITDSCGTQVTTGVPLTVAAAATPTLSVTNTASCASNTGTITVLAGANQGGGQYLYALIAPSPVTRPNQASPIFTGLPAGSYTVQITDQCGATGVTITTIAAAGAFTPAAGGSVVSCNGSNYNAQIIVTNPQNHTPGGPIPPGSGGGPYTYALYNFDNTVLLAGPQSSNVFSVVVPVSGNPSHTVRVTDVCGNTSTTTVAVNPPTPLSSATLSAITASCAATPTGVMRITTVAAGGFTPYTYTLLDAVTLAVVQGPQSNITFNNVPANPTGYLVRTTDACGNTTTSGAAVLFPAAATPTASVATTASCASPFTGRIVVTPGTGATMAGGTFSYALYDAGNTVLISGLQSSPVFNNVAPATYTVRIIDRCGTTGTVPATVASGVAAPVAAATAANTCASSNTGSITASATGGSLPVTYTLLDAAGTTVITGPQSSNIFTGLAAGTYTIRVTDACSSFDDAPGIIVGTLSATPTLNTSQALDCAGSVVIGAYGSGGNGGPYTYAICNGAGCTTFGAFGSSSTFTVTASGVYRIAVRDRCGNETSSADIAVNIPVKPVISAVTKLNPCGPTNIIVSFSGVPNTPYYSLDGANFSATIGTVGLGAHTIRVADFNAGTFGCASDVFNFFVGTNPTITNPVNTAGSTGVPFSETFTQTNGALPVTFSTSSTLPNGLTLSSAGVLSGIPTQTGTFPIVVLATDANSCVGVGSTYTLVITLGCPTITVTNPVNTNGTAGVAFSETFTAAGGAPSYTFTTSSTLPTGLTLSTGGILSGTPTQVGTFPIVVAATDINSCTGTSSTYNLVISICLPLTTNGCANGDSLTYFSLKGASGTVIYNHSGPVCNASPLGYSDYTGTIGAVTLVRGETFGGFMRTGNTNDYASIWIDANDNSVFESTERVLSNLQIGTISKLYAISIPSTMALGLHRMRVRVVNYASAPGAGTDPCSLYANGETEDYLANITNVGTSRSVAAGTAGSCVIGSSITIGPESNNHNAVRVFFVDSSNNYIAGISPNGNNLGTVTSSFYRHNGPVRQDSDGKYYHDRNITIAASIAPSLSYSLRYFYLNSELNALIAQPGSGVTSQFDLVSTKTSSNICSNAFITNNSVLISPTGFGSLGGDRFLDFTGLTGLSSFFLHAGPTVLSSCPVLDQSVTALPTSVCTGGSSTITVGASQPGVNYTLRIDPANTYVAGPTASNGPAINFPVGPLAATTTYNVLAETDNYSVYLNGGNAGFVIPQHGALDLTNNFTIEGWIKPDNASGFSRMFNKSQAYALGLSNGQSDITFTRHNAGDFSVPYTFTTGVWYHIACTYVSGTVEFFVNGVSVGTVGGVPGIVTSGLGAQIGSESSAFHFFEGNIDNVRIWNSVRTQAEIAANQSLFLTSTGNPSLVASWWIIEGSGNALDYSANGINATSFAGTWQTDSPVPSCSIVLTNKPTVSITADNTITLTSAAGTNNQTVCLGNAITTITYSTTGATGATFSGLPAGVTGSWAANVVTISGTPGTAVGSPFNYTVDLTGGCGTVSATGSITVTSVPTPTITPGGPTTFCAGGSVTLTSSSASGNQWYESGNPIGGATNQNYVATASGSYTVVVTIAGCSSAPSAPVVVTVNPAPPTPTITPGGPTTFCAGGSVTLTSSSASGNQWYESGNPIGGATNQNYVATTVGTYTVVVTIAGCSSAPSSAVVVTVNPLPVANATPLSQTICSGGTITTIAITGTGTTYDWTRDNTGTVTGIAASGSGDISGSLTNTTNAPVTVTFTITPTANSCPGTPITATVVVNPTPVVDPIANQAVCNGANSTAVNFSSPTTGGTVTYNWTNNDPSIGLAASGTGNIGSFVATNATNAPVTATITVTPSFTSSGGGPGNALIFDGTNDQGNASIPPVFNDINANNFTIEAWVYPTASIFARIVYAQPSITNFATMSMSTGQVIYFYVVKGGTTYSVATTAGMPLNAWTHVAARWTAATNTPEVFFNGVLQTTVNGGTSSTGTSGIMSIGTRPGGAQFFPGRLDEIRIWNTARTQAEISGAMNTSLPGNTPGIEVYYKLDEGAGTTANDATPAANTATLSGAPAWLVPSTAPVTATVTCNGAPETFTITVNPTPDAIATPASQTTCSGQTITTIALTGNVSGTVFNWTRDNTGTVTGIAASGSGDISGALTNTTASPITVTFTITPIANSCPGTAITATVLVYPTPDATATPTSQTICSGATITTIVLTGTVPGTVFNWTRDNTGPVTGIAASGSGDISGALTNTTNAPVTVTFTITPTASGCTAGAPITATVLVNPTPIVDPVANQALCNGMSTTAVNFTSPTTGGTVTYNWTNNDPSIGLAASGTGNIASFIATNTTNAPVTATITVTPSTSSGGGGGGLIPEVLYYKFDGSGTSVPNLASAPPPGTNPATLMGGLTQGGTAICDGTIIGTGAASTTDYLNTGWAPNLGTGSWTISFKSENITPSATLFYVFGDVNTNAFRCFTNGIAGANNWVLRGAGLIDTYINGGATVAPHTNTFVYDASLNEVRAYLDGVLVSTVAQGTPNVSGAGPFKFNGYSTAVGSPANGHYDEFMVFNRALTPAEITSLTSCPVASGLTCTGAPQTFTITVNPKPILQQTYNGVQVTANNDGSDDTGSFAICSSTNPNLFLTEITDVLGITPSNKVKVEQIVIPTNVTHNLAPSGTFVLSSIGPIPLARTVTLISPFVSGNLEIRRRAFFDDNLNNIIDANECLGDWVVYNVTVNPIPVVNPVANQVVCNNNTTAPVNFTGPVAGTAYNWTNSDPSIGLAASGSGNIPSFIALNTGTSPVTSTITVTPVAAISYTVYRTHNGNGSTSQYGAYANNAADFITMFSPSLSNTTVIAQGTGTASPLLNFFSSGDLTSAGIPAPGDYFGVDITAPFTAAESGVYTFGIDGDDGVDLSIDGVVVASFYGAHGFGGYQTGTISLVAGQTYTLRARMQEYGGGEGLSVVWQRPSQSSMSLQPSELTGSTCTGTPASFTITVNPTPVVNAVASQQICNGGNTTAINFSSPTTGGTIVYNWTNNDPSIGLAANGSGGIASFVATNTGNAPVTATITVTPSYTNASVTCAGAPITFTITVYPTPQVDPVANQVVCNNASTAPVNFTSPTTGGVMSYNWVNNTPSIGLAANGTGNIPSFVATNAGNSPVTATITVTPVSNNAGSPVIQTFNYTGAIQTFTVPPGVTSVTITSAGAQGGTTTSFGPYPGGMGATMTGTFAVTPGQVLDIIVGGRGNDDPSSSGGGGGSGVNTSGTALIVAGGGAGVDFQDPNYPGRHAVTTTNGVDGNGNIGSGGVAGADGGDNIYSGSHISRGGRGWNFNSSGSFGQNGVSGSTTTTNGTWGLGGGGGSVGYGWCNCGAGGGGYSGGGSANINATGGGGGSFNSGTAQTNTAGNNTGNGYVSITYATSSVVCTGPSQNFTITVNPTPIVNAVANQTVCNGGNTTAVNFTSPTTGGTIVYNWTNNNTTIGLGANGTGNIASFVATNTTNAPVTATITVTPSYTNAAVTCVGAPITFTITVNPTATINTVANQNLCNGSATAAVNFSSPTTGGTIVYNWTNNNTTIGLGANGTGNIASFVATNTTNNPVTATITVTPTFTNGVSCVGTPITFTITVYPTPQVDQPVNQIVCNNTNTAPVNFTSPTTGSIINYIWTNNTTSIGLASAGVGNIPSFVGTNATNAPVTATITVTPSNSVNNALTFDGTTQQVNVNPAPTIPIGNSPYTIEAWVRPNSISGANGIVGWGAWSNVNQVNAFRFNGPTQMINYWWGNDLVVNIPNVLDGNWHHVVATFDGTTRAIYFDGVLAGSDNPTGHNVPFANNLTIARTCPHCFAGEFFNGSIDEMRIWNVGKTQAQILANMNSTMASNSPGLAAYYRLDEGSGSLTADLTGNGNNGVLVNNPAWMTPSTAPFSNVVCVGPAKTFTITVNPTATVNAVANQTVCNGANTAAVNFSSPQTGGTITYSWTNNNTAIGLGANGTGNIASFVGTNTTNAPITATITVTPTFTNGVSCVGTPITFTITVNPTATVNAVANQTVCNGANTAAVNFSSPTTGGTIVYNWTNNDPSIGLAASGTGDIASFVGTNTTNAPVTATITVTPTFTNVVSCVGTPLTFTITVNPTPVVNAVANQFVCNNSLTTVNFSSPTTGGTLVYNWTNTNPAIGLAASGSGNLSFTSTNTTPDPISGTITVTPSFTNNGVTCVGAPISFTITVNPTVVINQVADMVVCNGAATPVVNFTTATSIGTVVYNWTNTNPAIGLGASGTGNIGSFTATNTTNAPISGTITVIPTYINVISCVGTPMTFTITVNPTATVNAVANQVLCNGANTTAINFSSPQTGGTIVYNWTNNDPSIGLAASGNGNIASFVATNNGTAPVTATIIVTPAYTNGGTTCNGTPLTFTITVNPTATINAVANQTVCNGANTTAINFSSPASGGTIAYNWTNNNTSIGLTSSGTGNIASFVAVNTGSSPQVATIVVTPAFTNGGITCNGTPITITITVNPSAIANQAPNQLVCTGVNTAPVIFSSPTTGGTIVYNWTNNTPAIGLPSSGTGNIPSIVAANPTNAPLTATITVIPAYTNGVMCNGIPMTFTITVNPRAIIDPVPTQVYCPGIATAPINFSSPTTGGTIAYHWSNSDPAIGLAASGIGNIPSFFAANTTNAPLVATITVIPYYTSGGLTCVGTTSTFTITVNPTATVNAVANQVVCNGGNTTAVNFTSGTIGGTIVYNWANNNTAIGLASGGAGNIPSFVATNTTNAPIVATITVTPSYTNGGVTCDGTPRSFTITVNPTPNAIATPASQTVCSNAPMTTIALTSNVAGTVYTWTRDNTINVGGIAVSGNGNISGTPINLTNVQQTVTFTITPFYTNGGVTCSGAPITATVIIPAPITITCPANITVNAAPGTCTANVTFAATATGTPAPTITYSHAPGSSFPVGTTTVTATATNSCGTVSCTFTITVVDVRVPVITTQPTDQTVCEASTATFTVAATNATAYQWQIYVGSNTWTNIAGATGATLTLNNVTLNQHLSLYRVQVTGPCGTVTTSLFVTLRINALPTIQLNPSIFPTLLVPGQALTITATGIQPGGGFFTWRKNNVIIPGVTGNVLTGLTIADQGVITATYTDANGCTSLPKSITIGALQTVNFFLYPNPNQGNFNISFYNQLNEQVTVLIYNSGNQLVYQRVHGSGALPYSVININLGSRLADGQYVLLLMNAKGEKVGTKQFLIHRQ